MDNAYPTINGTGVQSNFTAAHQFTDREIETIKNTVARGATNDELCMFLAVCKSAGLNPFRKEVWFIKTRDKATGIISTTGSSRVTF